MTSLWIFGKIHSFLKNVSNVPKIANCIFEEPLKLNIIVDYLIIIIFLSAVAVMQVIFSTEDNFCFISDCGNSFNCKLKKLINEQIVIFYSPSNALCLSDEDVQIKTS